MIHTYANFRKDNWDEHLIDIEVAYNSAVNSVTLCTPFYRIYGMNPRTIPLETQDNEKPSVTEFLDTTQNTTKFARERIISQNYSMEKQASKTRKNLIFQAGDRVLLSTKN